MNMLIAKIKMKLIHKWASQFALTLVKLIEVDGTMYIRDNQGKLWAIGRDKSARQPKNKSNIKVLPTGKRHTNK